MKVLESKITDQDDFIYKLSQEYDLLKSQMADLGKSIKANQGKE